MKRFAIGLMAAVIVIALFFCVFGDWFQRHNGFSGYPDRITVFLYSDENPIPTSDYELTLYGSDQIDMGPVRDRGKCWSLSGDYGTYDFALTYQGKTASFFLENTNDWWRTVVLLRLREDGKGLEQINCVYNTNPPWMEVYMIDWDSEQAEPAA